MQSKHTHSLAGAIFVGIMRFMRPLLGPDGMCIFAPYTCTLFAADQLNHKPLGKALLLILWRLLRCNPINGLLFWWHNPPNRY
jgi:putative component of membrane protein insertase Oxa1/YidC/SpoIIIJ protein YidD